jgi:hypothetical protein
VTKLLSGRIWFDSQQRQGSSSPTLRLRDCPAWQRKASTCGRALLPHADKHMFVYVLELCKSEGKRAALAYMTRPGFKTWFRHVGFMVNKVALGQIFSEYFGFPCQSSFHQFLHNHYHLSITRGWYNRPVSGRSTQNPTPLIKKTRLS